VRRAKRSIERAETMHVAIIMDGNGRWATSHGWARWKGHVAGVESVRAVVEAAPKLGIRTLTLYAFSSDNWKRPRGEVTKLFRLLRQYCRRERAQLLAQGVRVSAIGRRDRIPERVLEELERLEAVTRNCGRLHLRIALDYSARTAIAEAVRTLAVQPHLSPSCNSNACEELHQLITGGVPDPDLLIRTAGEKRLSDFLLWELSYTELYFTDVRWPEFREAHLVEAIDDFHNRGRRFGGTGDNDPFHTDATNRLAG